VNRILRVGEVLPHLDASERDEDADVCSNDLHQAHGVSGVLVRRPQAQELAQPKAAGQSHGQRQRENQDCR
jgi:hypothetical protein